MPRKLRPVAVITGDVHHQLTESSWDQREAELALKYVRIALDLGVKVTLFVTGKCVEKYSDILLEIKREAGDDVEFGGHTFNAFLDFKPAMLSKMLHLGFKVASGSLYGPRRYQYRDIKKTIKVFKNKLGVTIKVWRTHFYASNEITYKLLSELGFRAVSDKRLIMFFKVKKEVGNLYHVYITAPPDGVIEPDNREWNEEWKASMWNYVKAEVEREANIVFNLHPKRMAMLDYFVTFREILKFLRDSGYRFLTMSEVVEEAVKGLI